MNDLMIKIELSKILQFRKTFLLGFILLAMVMISIPTKLVSAEQVYNDAAAIGELKHAKGVFWLELKDPRKTAKYLEIITHTHQRFIKQGVLPDLILMFNGPMVGYLTTKPADEVAMAYEQYLKSIAKNITKLDELGVRMEVCNVANQIVGVKPETLLPGLITVNDGAISLIGWQYQGYKLVPIF